MQRYILIITNSGLDAVMPIATGMGDVSNLGERVKIIMAFEYGENGLKMNKSEYKDKHNKILDKYKQLREGGAYPQEYAMFDLRFRFAGDGAKKYYIGLNANDMSKIRSTSPEESAFYILDILITGKTEFGRFEDDGSEETIFGVNLNKDWDKADAKRRRRIFYNAIIKVEDDPDEI